MGSAREPRESEKQIRQIYDMLPSLFIMLWFPMYDEALEQINHIKMVLTRLEKQIKIENENKK